METAPATADIDDSCTQILINDLANRGKRLSVLINGEESQSVIAYNCEEGWIKRHKLKDGKPYVDPGQDRAATELVKGTITAIIVSRENNSG